MHLCRLCGLTKPLGINIYDTSSKETEISAKIHSLLPKKVIRVSADDQFSKFICVECRDIIEKFSEFCKMVEEVQIKMSAIQETESGATVCVGNDGKVRCLICGNTVEIAEGTTLHMVSHGIGTVICRCEQCDKMDILSEFLFPDCSLPRCKYCSILLPKRKKSSNCDKANIRKAGNHICTVCSKSFQSRANLLRHKVVHSGAKPFLCDVCGTGFSQRCSLKFHVQSHTGQNPHVCKECRASFRFKISLQSHMLTMHRNSEDDISSYNCEYCNKKFATVYKLKRHQRSHTGERPYSCLRCGKLFSQSGNLKLHVRKHEEEDCVAAAECLRDVANFDLVDAENISYKHFNTTQVQEAEKLKEQSISEFLPLETNVGSVEFLVTADNALANKDTNSLLPNLTPECLLLIDDTNIPSSTPDLSLPTFSSLQTQQSLSVTNLSL